MKQGVLQHLVWKQITQFVNHCCGGFAIKSKKTWFFGDFSFLLHMFSFPELRVIIVEFPVFFLAAAAAAVEHTNVLCYYILQHLQRIRLPCLAPLTRCVYPLHWGTVIPSITFGLQTYLITSLYLLWAFNDPV